jgi:hypothetical protein
MPVPSDLMGKWIPEAAAGEPTEGPFTEVEFLNDGKLRFSLKGEGVDEALVMDYRTEGHTIVTRPPGAAADARTKYELGQDGSLLLEYGGHKGRYVKAN